MGKKKGSRLETYSLCSCLIVLFLLLGYLVKCLFDFQHYPYCISYSGVVCNIGTRCNCNFKSSVEKLRQEMIKEETERLVADSEEETE